jgi:hypothetical protein
MKGKRGRNETETYETINDIYDCWMVLLLYESTGVIGMLVT